MELVRQVKITLNDKRKIIIEPTAVTYNSIDLMKFICAMFVVCIHTSPLNTYSSALDFGLKQIVARLGVPFFFLSAGYFFFKKIDISVSDYIGSNSQYFKSYIKRLGTLYVIWSSIYFIYDIYSWTRTDGSIVKYVLSSVRDFFLVGVSGHLWYMAGLILAIVLSYYALKYFSFRSALMIGGTLYVIGLLGDSYFGLINSDTIIGVLFKMYNSICLTTRNGIFFGFIFVVIGAYLSKKEFSISNRTSCILFSTSFLLMTIEAITLQVLHIPKDYNMYVFLIPTTVFLFLLLLNIKLKPHPIYKYLRNLSVLIYFSHILFNIIYPKIFEILNLSEVYQNSIVRFLLTMGSSIVFSSVIIWLSQFKCFKFLKMFY